jgi:hypothetical protein
MKRRILDVSLAVALLVLAILSAYSILDAPATTTDAGKGVALAVTVPVVTPGAETPAEPAIAPPPAPEAIAPVPAPAPPDSPAPTPSGPVAGRVLGPGGKPLAGAAVVANGTEIRTDAEGRFALDKVVDAEILVKMPGYAKVRVRPAPSVEVALKPHAVKAAYLTYFGVGDKGIRGRVSDLLTRTELNAVVIDVKGDRGWIPYRTEVPMALTVGAQGPVMLRDIEGMLADYRARGVYTIACWPASARTWPSSTPAPASPGWTARTWPGSIRSGRRSGPTTWPSPRRPSARGSTRSSSTTSASPPTASWAPPGTRRR